MRKPWPFALVVIVAGGVAGLAIAGRPVSVDPFVIGPGTTGAISTSSTSVSASTTSTSVPATTTTIEATTSVPASTSVAVTTAPTTVSPTTAEPPTTTTIPGPLLRNQVRLVIANGDGRFRLASITADRIRSLGYIITLGDAFNTVDATVIYYRPNFDDEAAFAAIDIGVPDAIILAFPTNAQPITNSDDSGDVIIVLGPDAPR